MADDRLMLHQALLDTYPGVKVYYQPPGDMLLPRPCIVYTTLQNEAAYASNQPYVIGTRFQVTLLADIPGYFDRKLMFYVPGVSVVNNNGYVSEDVIHDVFTVVINTITL
jgi:hypothetical protein